MYRLYARAGLGSVLVETQLAWSGLKHHLEAVGDLYKEPEARDRVLSINPLAQIPTLILPDGAVMTESAAITLLLADMTGRDDLAPEPAASERGRFLRWLIYMVTNIYPTFTYADDPAHGSSTANGPFQLTRQCGRLRETAMGHRGSRGWGAMVPRRPVLRHRRFHRRHDPMAAETPVVRRTPPNSPPSPETPTLCQNWPLSGYEISHLRLPTDTHFLVWHHPQFGYQRPGRSPSPEARLCAILRFV